VLLHKTLERFKGVRENLDPRDWLQQSTELAPALPSVPLPPSSFCPEPSLSSYLTGNDRNANGRVIAASGPGRLGNRLFQAAAAVVDARSRTQPLAVQESYWNSATVAAYFPCFHSDAHRHANFSERVPRQGGPFFQDLRLWEQTGLHPAANLELMRVAFWSPLWRTSPLSTPASEDLVIYFRTFGYEFGLKQDGKLFSDLCLAKRSNGAMRICHPPFEFFAHAVELHRSQSGTISRVMCVCEPRMRSHPMVRRMVAVLGVTLVTDGRDEVDDFDYIRRAKHIALSFSTFGWWAAYLSHASVIHFPVPPIGVPAAWCSLLPVADPRFVFHDVWARTISTDATHARRRCNDYLQNCTLDEFDNAMCPSGASTALSHNRIVSIT